MKSLKLNYKNTLFIGCAFFSILMLWQVYNTYCPLFLHDLLGQYIPSSNERLYVIGVIMAADNIFALILLPIFGFLSDKTKTRFGKRMPYIVVGMILAAIAFPFIGVFYIQNNLVGVIIMMGIILMIMHIYRTPAVSLMPDVTPKPLRSKANGLINLIGYIGPILAGLIKMISNYQEHPVFPFIFASVAMVIACLIIMFTINENKILDEMCGDLRLGEELSQSLGEINKDKPLSRQDKKNMFILLLSVFLWFMAFNAVESYMSLYCRDVLENESLAGLGTIVLTICSIITFIPSGILANKIGRKRSVAIGLVVIIAGFLLVTISTNAILFFLGVAMSGIGWAMINVNSYPMICEMAHQGNIGRLSGFYYTSSMIAQSLTPIVLGLIMSFMSAGLNALFYYSTVLMILALAVFIIFKENKQKVEKIKKGLEIFEID